MALVLALGCGSGLWALALGSGSGVGLPNFKNFIHRREREHPQHRRENENGAPQRDFFPPLT